MITYSFNLVAQFLHQLARTTNLTYNQINIIVYFAIIPLSWFFMLDSYFSGYFFTIGFLIFLIGFKVGCRNFKQYSDELFMKSVHFLNFFNRFGSNYYMSSVLICVVVPIFIYVVLFYLILVK
jgi:hypothetical protein